MLGFTPDMKGFLNVWRRQWIKERIVFVISLYEYRTRSAAVNSNLSISLAALHFFLEGIEMNKHGYSIDAFLYQQTPKKRRDSSHLWRRIQSRKYRPTILKKVVYLTLITVAFALICLLYTKPTDTLALLWAILFIAIIIPDKSEEKKDESFSDCLREVEEIERRTQDPTTPEARYVAEIRERSKEKVRLMV